MSSKSAFSVIVVTGLSGAGKSTALRVFEDLGFFCIDGLPAGILPKLAGMFQGLDRQYRGLALGMDLRQRNFPEEWDQAASELEALGVQVQVVFLESRPDVLLKRYAQTRRPHPLECRNLGLEQALELERQLLSRIRKSAELVIDTTGFSIHDLRRVIQEKWATLREQSGAMRVHIVSFGFKYGLPIDADLVFDMRFLPNPYFDETLRPLSGKDPAVAEFALGNDMGREFLQKFQEFLVYLLPLYVHEGRYRVTLGIGCTGGRHRSVAVAETVFQELKQKGYAVTLEHRHLELG
ncbi:MAG: RNase adapter RapZ [Desulfovibrionaceae bacterium]